MKMKKGFTLVELLATITMIGILSVIATTGYQSISTRVKKQQYENKVSYIETQAANFASETGYLSANVGYLVSLGYVEADNNKDEVINPIDKTSMNCNVVTITQEEDTFYGHYEETQECDVTNIDMVNVNLAIVETEDKDNGREIATNEWTKENVILSAKFLKSNIDKSQITKITWYSNTDKQEISVDNNFDEVNKYKVRAELILNSNYRIEIELADGTIYQASRVVKIDKQSPLLYSSDIKVSTPNNYTNEYKNVQISSTDQNGSGIAGYYIGTNQDCTSNDFYASNEETYNKTFDNGTYYTCSIDNVGNVSDTATFTIERVDYTAPSCNIVIDGTKGENDWYTSDVTFKITGEDEEGGSGVKTQKISSTELKNDTSSYTVTAKVRDRAGNESVCSVTVKRDTVAPSCTQSGGSTQWVNTSRTIYWGCSDATSGCKSGYSGGSTYYSPTNSWVQTTTISAYTIKDNAGNTRTCGASSANVYVDKTIPACSFTGESTTWTNSDRTITATCSDSGSGCTTATTSKTWSYTSGTTQTASLSYTIYDNAGNSNTCSNSNANIYVDKDKPTCTFAGESTTWTNSNRTITATCSDTGSGCTTATASKTWSYTSGTTKTASLSYTIYDNAGNSNTCKKPSANIYVDKTAPTCTHSENTTWTNQNYTLTWGCSDSGSGCNSSYSGSSKVISTTAESAAVPKYTIKDNAGNTTTCDAISAVSVKVDKDAPTCTATKSNTGTTSGVTITYSCDDTGSGVSNCPTAKTGQKSDVASISITDAAGNTATCGKVTITSSTTYTKTSKKCIGTTKNNTKTYSGSTAYSDCITNCKNKGLGECTATTTTSTTCTLKTTTTTYDWGTSSTAKNQTSCTNNKISCDEDHVNKTYVSCSGTTTYS
jgi:prepilin-type N-terminal cleavage/methylation domain-containing protein